MVCSFMATAISLLPIDICWVNINDKEEYFKAKVFLDNQVHIRYPSWPYSLLHD